MARDEFVELCLELLAPLGAVRARRMFGGHGLYLDDLFVAIVAGQRLYLKADAATAGRFDAAGCEPFVYSARGRSVALNYRTVPAEAMESPALMAPWARLAVQAALSARRAAAAQAAARPRAGARRAGGASSSR
jgi:DNA transformation protein and related proteins